jgi:hypothetical protein
MITPTRKPTTPQKAVAMAPARMTPSKYSCCTFGLGSPAAQHPQKGDACCQHHVDRVDLIGQVARVVGRNRGKTAIRPSPISLT